MLSHSSTYSLTPPLLVSHSLIYLLQHTRYSGLLECPCTDRKPRVITQHSTAEFGQCADQSGLAALTDAATCFAQAANLGLLPILANATVNSSGTGSSYPRGCSVRAMQAGYSVTFNADAASDVPCGPANASAPVRATGVAVVPGTAVRASVDLDRGANCSGAPLTADLSGAWLFPGSSMYPASYKVTFKLAPAEDSSSAAAAASRAFVVGAAGPGAPCAGDSCRGILVGPSTFVMTRGFVMNATIAPDWKSMTFSNGATWGRVGAACAGRATLTLRGPADVWFGVGFGSSTMSPPGGGEGVYAISVDGGTGAVNERSLGDHAAGSVLAPSFALASSTVSSGGVRTVVLTRALAGPSAAYFSFDEHAASISIIGAVGSGATIAYHEARSGATLMLVEVGGPMCVCKGGVSGSIAGVPFNNHCSPTLANNTRGGENAVCDVRTYAGGLKCCAHKSILLDKAQTTPSQVDTYQMKFRLWYEEYEGQTPQYDHAFFMFITNDAGTGEYDIPQCAAGTPAEECIYTTESTFAVRDSMRKCAALSDGWCAPNWNETNDVLLLRAGTHCHAPACINETLYDVATGDVICFNRPLFGKGIAPDFDELDYAAGIPPCMWGSEADGLLPNPRLRLDQQLRIVKHTNATNAHYGVMAQWQMRGAWAPPL